jgi:hypothetical protein
VGCDNFVNGQPFLGAFATVNFVVSVRPSFRPSVRMEQFLSPGKDFHENGISAERVQTSLKSDKNNWFST